MSVEFIKGLDPLYPRQSALSRGKFFLQFSALLQCNFFAFLRVSVSLVRFCFSLFPQLYDGRAGPAFILLRLGHSGHVRMLLQVLA